MKVKTKFGKINAILMEKEWFLRIKTEGDVEETVIKGIAAIKALDLEAKITQTKRKTQRLVTLNLLIDKCMMEECSTYQKQQEIR